MLNVIVSFIFITIILFLTSIFKFLTASKERVDQRVEDLMHEDQIIDYREDDLNGNLFARIFIPFADSVGHLIGKISPKSKREQLEQLLRRAGQIEKVSVGKWYLKKGLIVIGIPSLFITLRRLFSNESSNTILFGLLLALIFNNLMTINLKRTIKKRQHSIRNDLPDALDLVTVSVEAGLSFDGAIDRVIRQMPSALSSELAIALKEMRMGKTRRDALRGLSQRCDVDDLTTLVGALIQADELGVSIGKVLRIQSIQMREKRRQRAREAAMKAPIKLLFPLMVFIFPTIFVILLGPAFIQMLELF